MPRHWAQVVKRAPKERRTSADGITFDSLAELKRWEELRLLERAGRIADLRRQVKFPLVLPNGVAIKTRSAGFPNGRACVYTADFAWIDPVTGAQTVEEHKGHDDTASRLRRAVAEAIYGMRIVITGAAAPRVFDGMADGAASYYAAIEEIGRRVKAGEEPVPTTGYFGKRADE